MRRQIKPDRKDIQTTEPNRLQEDVNGRFTSRFVVADRIIDRCLCFAIFPARSCVANDSVRWLSLGEWWAVMLGDGPAPRGLVTLRKLPASAGSGSALSD